MKKLVASLAAALRRIPPTPLLRSGSRRSDERGRSARRPVDGQRDPYRLPPPRAGLVRRAGHLLALVVARRALRRRLPLRRQLLRAVLDHLHSRLLHLHHPLGGRAEPALSVPRDWRVAMVVTKAPSEPFDIVRTTLLAMLDQTYPHDTWLADEDPSPETLDWCRDHGVFVSTRRGVAAYHRTSWPRRPGARKAISRTSTTGLATTTTISCRSSMPITCRPAPISRRCCGRSSIRQSATCRRRASATAMRP